MKRVVIVKEQYYYVGPCMNKQLIRHENGMGMNGDHWWEVLRVCICDELSNDGGMIRIYRRREHGTQIDCKTLKE